jgi:hypothetical protein
MPAKLERVLAMTKYYEHGSERKFFAAWISAKFGIPLATAMTLAELAGLGEGGRA